MLGELSHHDIENVLKRNYLGRIGCAADGNVYIVPMNYRYENDSVICYSLEGQKIEMMRNNPTVCFEVDEIADTDHWKCVIVHGTFQEITDEQELRVLRPRYNEYRLRRKADLTSTPSHQVSEDNKFIAGQIFFKIKIRNLSGRFENGF